MTRLKLIIKTIALSSLFIVGVLVTLNAGEGCELNETGDCLTCFSHYQTGTSLPCIGDYGGCSVVTCGPIIM